MELLVALRDVRALLRVTWVPHPTPLDPSSESTGLVAPRQLICVSSERFAAVVADLHSRRCCLQRLT